ncbi:glucose-6-phosphate dehydrogenase [Streptomyces sp. ISL-66]|uniref:glucose-6-phosphate dehydrogenase n=1 Tax=Streptomyces sp. ISL-66 TaxID=2819186 RepID=UPI001BEC93B0|nr:glucose-6-phosphate dehydrogenase [Streptomyces sp. ISL-66]MBT2468195.1 glucose-6-phosphate dehydrogenase [Streptomyces sp. ISL-66]
MAPSNTLKPCDFVIFGGTGDLAKRKLLPALYMYERESRLPADFRIIAVSREEWSTEQFRDYCEGEDAVKGFLKGAWEQSVWDVFRRRLHHAEAQLGESSPGLPNLAKILPMTPNAPLRVFYMALPSELMGPTCEAIRDQGLASGRDRVVLEKPIGASLVGAKQVHERIRHTFGENDIYRIDHYLGKETVHNIPVLRSDSSLLGLLWDHAWVDRVEISVSEEVGAGDRIEYYETAGALRDMVQNHLLQILCLVAMEPAENSSKATLRVAKCEILKSLGEIAEGDSVRGQYEAGSGMPGYSEEVGAFAGVDSLRRAPNSTLTETFVAIRVRLNDNSRWRDVPFFLRTGKRLDRREAQVVMHFVTTPTSGASVTPKRLVIHIQPDDGATLFVSVSGSYPSESADAQLELHFPRAFPSSRTPEAYERLLADVVNGDPELFVSGAEVEASWKWIDSIKEMWNSGTPDLRLYPAGTTGPATGEWPHDGRAPKKRG